MGSKWFRSTLGLAFALALVATGCGGGHRLDAVVTSVTTAQGWIDAGNEAKIVGEPLFYEPLGVGFDKSASLDPQSLVAAVSGIVEQMHADGTLTAMSTKWYGIDLTIGPTEQAGGAGAPAPSEPVCTSVDQAAGDLLARICQDGEIRVSTDPAYPPQSLLNETTGEFEGFDIDVATEIANRLGVNVAWKQPSWDVLIAGGWNDRWDMSVGSMTTTKDRQEVLYFTPPYYYTPAVVVVRADDTAVKDLSTDLDGKKIGVCGGCTYDYFLQKTLDIPGYTFNFIIDDADIHTYDTDSTALQDLQI
jgi:ABC-type amino acid transport substrate-binding protein